MIVRVRRRKGKKDPIEKYRRRSLTEAQINFLVDRKLATRAWAEKMTRRDFVEIVKVLPVSQ
jgi:hypothetical protein